MAENKLHEMYEIALGLAAKEAAQKPKISEEEQKRINCRESLKSYLEKMFVDEKLENLLFNSRDSIELFRADNIEMDDKGTKANVVYGLNGIGAYRRLNGVDLFQNIFHYRWGHHNSPFALAYALAEDSKANLKPEQLHATIISYLHKKVPATSEDIAAGFAALTESS